MIKAESHIKPFPALKLKNKELIFKFLNMYISSHHKFGKLIFTLLKEFKNMTVQEFDKLLASLVYDFQMYLTSYISYQQIFKIDIRKLKDLFKHINSQEMEIFDTCI